MTLIYAEGFEVYGDASIANAAFETGLNLRPFWTWNTTGYTGDEPDLIDDFESSGYALRMPATGIGQGARLRMELPAAYKTTLNASTATLVFGMRVRIPDDVANQAKRLWEFKQAAGSSLINLNIAANGTDLEWVDSTGTQTLASAVTAGEWHYIELHFKPTSNTNGGFVNIDVDGTQIYSSGSRSLAAPFFSAWGFQLNQDQAVSNTGDEWTAFDDVYVLDVDGVTHTDALGPVRIVGLVPTSDDTPNDWTPSTGTDNFAVIDDVTTADYVDAITNGDDDHYGLTTLPASDSVHGLQIDVVCVAVDGTPTLLIGFDNGTADESNEGVISTGSDQCKRALFTTDPSGAAWNTSSVNSAEATQRMTE